MDKGVNRAVDLRPYRPGDETQILTLFRESYGRELGERAWAWRFRDNPAGPGIIYLAWDGDILAAHYAVTSVAFRIDGRDRLTGLSGTTMTHPDYRGQRLFPILAERTYSRMAELGMAMVWGFPNLFSHRGLIKDLRWVDVYEVPTFRLPLSPGLSLPESGDGVIELDAFDERFDALWDQVKDDSPVSVKRDRAYLQWRYVRNPTAQYRLLACVEGAEVTGYAVFKRFYSDLQIVDILTRPDAAIGVRLLARAVQIGLENSALGLSLWLNVTHRLHHALEKLGFRNGESITYFGARAMHAPQPDDRLYDYRRWYLMMGDSDVF